MHELGNADAHITIEVKPDSWWNLYPTFANGLQDMEQGAVKVLGISRYREVPEDFQGLFANPEYTNGRDSVWVRFVYIDDPNSILYLPTKVFLGCTTHI